MPRSCSLRASQLTEFDLYAQLTLSSPRIKHPDPEHMDVVNITFTEYDQATERVQGLIDKLVAGTRWVTLNHVYFISSSGLRDTPVNPRSTFRICRKHTREETPETLTSTMLLRRRRPSLTRLEEAHVLCPVVMDQSGSMCTHVVSAFFAE